MCCTRLDLKDLVLRRLCGCVAVLTTSGRTIFDSTVRTLLNVHSSVVSVVSVLLILLLDTVSSGRCTLAKMLLQVLTCLMLFAFTMSARILNCTQDFLEVEEMTTNFYLICDQHSAEVVWEYQLQGSSTVTIGKCTTSCQLDSALPQGFFTLTKITNVSSRLTFSSSATTKALGNTQYRCSEAKWCVVDVVVNAELGSPQMTVTTPSTGNGWTVHGTVDITRIYSSRGQYSCVWSYRRGSEQYTELDSDELFIAPSTPSTADKTGRCDLRSKPLPSNPGTYTYRVVVSPGRTEKSKAVVITSASVPTINCIPSTGYVSEYANLSCTCSGEVGQPQGRLRWLRRTTSNVDTSVKDGSYGEVTLHVMMTVNRTHNGNKLRCDVDWVTDITGPFRTITVAYGPDNARIPENSTFYTDSTGSRYLTLTCVPGDANPPSGLIYSWTGPCNQSTSDRCGFQPRPPGAPGSDDVNANIRCDVKNSINNKVAQATYRLQLKYAPRDAPQISGYTNNQILYQGDSVTITCAVTGGDPRVTSVTLTCTGHSQKPSYGQSSSLTVTSLSAGDHGAMCTCSGQWVKQDYYTLTDTRNLTVYSPPSNPVITRGDGKTRPYLERDNVTLICSVAVSGHPEGKLTWSGHENAVIATQNRVSSTLQLFSVGKGDNQHNITCRATNPFTEHKQRDLKDVETLHVYYGPYVTLEQADGNECKMTSYPATCAVEEGQRVHFRSIADSNPAPQSFAWQALSGSGLELPTGRYLDIVSIKRNHSGVYRVEVQTAKPDTSDTRLPLTSQRLLTLLVKYYPTNTSLVVNNNSTLTVNESQVVTFDCQSQGRPTPRLQLVHGGAVLRSEVGGRLSLSEETTRLSHPISTQCNNTGVYVCRANNGVGTQQQDDVELYVNCKPRKTTETAELPIVNFIKDVAFAEFKFEAYPLPTSRTFIYHGNMNNRSITKPLGQQISLSVTCFNTYAEYAVTCNISVDDVRDQSAVGFYSFRAGNPFGHEDFLFEVKINASEKSGRVTQRVINVGAIVGGIGAALIVIGVVAAVVILVLRRKKKAPKTSNQSLRPHQEDWRNRDDADDEVMIDNDVYDSTENTASQLQCNNTTRPNDYEDVDVPRTKPVILPKPTLGATAKDDSGKDGSAVVIKGSKPHSAPSTSADRNMYGGSVDKSKTTSRPSRPTSPGADGDPTVPPLTESQAVSNTKAKQKKETKPPKAKQDKGKKKDKKEEKVPFQMQQAKPEGAGYGNSPLSMNPIDTKVYENYAFQDDGTEYANGQNMTKPTTPEDSRTTNPDGLVYTTIAFSDNQLKMAEQPPPERETTEYAGIDFTRQAPPAQD